MAAGTLIGIVLNLLVNLGRIVILTILSLLIYERDTSLHLFRSSSVSLGSVF